MQLSWSTSFERQVGRGLKPKRGHWGGVSEEIGEVKIARLLPGIQKLHLRVQHIRSACIREGVSTGRSPDLRLALQALRR